jgi:hypothetical protein
MSAHAPMTQARFGRSGYSQLRGPGIVNLDASDYGGFRITSQNVWVCSSAASCSTSQTGRISRIPTSDVSESNFGVISV